MLGRNSKFSEQTSGLRGPAASGNKLNNTALPGRLRKPPRPKLRSARAIGDTTWLGEQPIGACANHAAWGTKARRLAHRGLSTVTDSDFLDSTRPTEPRLRELGARDSIANQNFRWLSTDLDALESELNRHRGRSVSFGIAIQPPTLQVRQGDDLILPQ